MYRFSVFFCMISHCLSLICIKIGTFHFFQHRLTTFTFIPSPDSFDGFHWEAVIHFLYLNSNWYLWWPICQRLGLDTWEAPRCPPNTDPATLHSWTQVSSQTSCTSRTSYWTPSGWLSSEAHFACQSNRGFGFPLRTWTGTHHFCWNLFCQDFNPDMAWCDSFGFHLF